MFLLCFGYQLYSDPAKRAEDEFYSNAMMMNIEVLNAYEAKKLSPCPHCFNTLKKRISELGDTKWFTIRIFLKSLLDGRLTIRQFKGKKITFHDPCYLEELIMCMKHQEI
jgi:Fe-S oxidoreductase